MAYATVEELAAALHTRVTPQNTDWLAKCLDAAAIEIDHSLDRSPDDPLPTDDALAGLVNVARGVEWWKANDAAFGGVGFPDTGILAVPRDPFARHAATLIPHKQRFGVA